eukprot:SAG31_NODE_874_length_11319_cov_3.145098_8_plen_59_part_00
MVLVVPTFIQVVAGLKRPMLLLLVVAMMVGVVLGREAVVAAGLFATTQRNQCGQLAPR